MARSKHTRQPETPPGNLPSKHELQTAITLYLKEAYEDSPPEVIRQRIEPLAGAASATFLMGDTVERREPGEAAPSFALRLGNQLYPNMKLRISLPSTGGAYVFSVDSHDMVLRAPAGSPDAAALEGLKTHNRMIAKQINDKWTAAGIYTEHAHMREMVRQAKATQDPQS